MAGKKRKTPEINAGSMADIAFLLLIFFLVTTTMDKEEGIKKTLPQKSDISTKILQRNLLIIKVNNKDQLLVEGNKRMEIGDLYTIAKEFLVNKSNSEKYPVFHVRNINNVRKNVAAYKQTFNQAEEGTAERVSAKKELDKWKDRLTTLEAIGKETFRQIDQTAAIKIEMNDASSYGRYIEIYSELQAAQNDLRKEVSLKYFGVPYEKLDEVEDADKIKAVRTIVPQRIIKSQEK